MTTFKRACISMVRRPGKSVIMFFIVFLLGMMTSGAISVSQAIITTEANLLRRIPPFATINSDSDAMDEHEKIYGERPILEPLTPEIFTNIGQLPYVRAFDYTYYGYNFFSSDLVLPTDPAPYSDIEWLEEEVVLDHLLINSYRQELGDMERFTLKGIYHPLVMDLEGGLIKLVSGRVFTEQEMNQSEPVILISQAFADANNLDVGATIRLEQNVYETFNSFSGTFSGHVMSDAKRIISEPIELKVIGIFTPTMVMNNDANLINVLNHINLNNRLYVPIEVAKSSTYLLLDYIQSNYPDEIQFFDEFYYEDILFQLNDSLDLWHFNKASATILPDFWFIHDLTYEFEAIANVMTGMQEIANMLVLGTVIASLTILGLLILLILHKRRQEIGIYLALGESRRQIVIQMLIEIVVISTFALTVSLFVGHLFANHVTQTMLQNDIISNPNVFINQDMGWANDFNRMGFGIHMTGEEMVEAYDVSLNLVTIFSFYGLGVLMIVLSTVFPILYLTYLNPKKVLLPV